MGGVEQNGAKWNILTEIAAPPRTNRLLLATNRLSHNRPLLFRICTEPVPNVFRPVPLLSRVYNPAEGGPGGRPGDPTPLGRCSARRLTLTPSGGSHV